MTINHEDIDPEGGWEAVVSPSRTCVGVVLATGLALAVARLSGGRYVDTQIGMMPGEGDPEAVVAATRLPASEDEFGLRCERYVRQFPQLNGWPHDRSALG